METPVSQLFPSQRMADANRCWFLVTNDDFKYCSTGVELVADNHHVGDD